MNALELTSKQAYDLWNLFGDLIGLDRLKETYGSYWPRYPVIGERVWVFYEDENKVGWCALRPDPIEPIVWQAIGVFPSVSNQGYVKKIFQWSIQKAFELYPKAEAMFYAVSKNNSFCEWVKNKNPERVVGEINFPEPYVIFMIKNLKKYCKE